MASRITNLLARRLMHHTTKLTHKPTSTTGFNALTHKFTNIYAGHPYRLFIFVCKSFCFYHVFTEYFYSLEQCRGASMLPTLEVVGDSVIISKAYRRGKGLKVGDVVAFKSVVDPDELVIKRILGVEGDYVVRDTPGVGSDKMIQVPEGHCWVVGDNLPYSRDSRHFGPMPVALIRGKVIAKAFPFSERKWLDDGLQVVD